VFAQQRLDFCRRQWFADQVTLHLVATQLGEDVHLHFRIPAAQGVAAGQKNAAIRRRFPKAGYG